MAKKLYTNRCVHRGIAQLVEQWSPKPRAVGSNPTAPAKKTDIALAVSVFFCAVDKGDLNPVSETP